MAEVWLSYALPYLACSTAPSGELSTRRSHRRAPSARKEPFPSPLHPLNVPQTYTPPALKKPCTPAPPTRPPARALSRPASWVAATRCRGVTPAGAAGARMSQVCPTARPQRPSTCGQQGLVRRERGSQRWESRGPAHEAAHEAVQSRAWSGRSSKCAATFQASALWPKQAGMRSKRRHPSAKKGSFPAQTWSSWGERAATAMCSRERPGGQAASSAATASAELQQAAGDRRHTEGSIMLVDGIVDCIDTVRQGRLQLLSARDNEARQARSEGQEP